MICDSEPNVYQVWTFYEIIHAVQTEGQSKHYRMPDPHVWIRRPPVLECAPWPKIEFENVDKLYE